MAWPAATRAFAAGINLRHADSAGTSYELAFIGSVIGCAAGMLAVGRLQPILSRGSLSVRLSIGFVTAAGAAFAATGLVLVAAAFAPGAVTRALPWGSLVPAILITIAHLSSMSLTILVSPIPPSARPFVLLASSWVLPVFAPAIFTPLALLRVTEGARTASTSQPWTALVADFEPILLWLTAALLLEATNARRA